MSDEENEDDRLAPAQSDCRCGECCRRLIIEVGLEDAEREPKIKEMGAPLNAPAEVTGGQREVEGYRLNKMTPEGHACVFLDEKTSLCTIYETRPDVCRAFDCDGKGKDQLIELGYPPGTPHTERLNPERQATQPGHSQR